MSALRPLSCSLSELMATDYCGWGGNCYDRICRTFKTPIIRASQRCFLPSLLLWSARDQISLLTRIALGMILVSKSLFVVGSSIDQSAFKHHSLTDSLTAGRRQSNENEAPITTKTGLRVENGTELQSRYTKTLKFHFVFLWCSLNHCGRGIR